MKRFAYTAITLTIVCHLFGQVPGLVWGGLLEKNISPLVIATDKTGNIFIIGNGYKIQDLDPGPGTYTLDFSTNSFIAKYNQNGSIIWASLLSNDLIPPVASIKVDDFGNVFTAFRNNDIIISKHDPNGKLLWNGKIGSSGFDELRDINVDKDGNLYLVGGAFTSANDLDLDPGPLTSTHVPHTFMDGFLVKISSNGIYQWSKLWGTDQTDCLHSVAVNSELEVVVSGIAHYGIDLDPGIGTCVVDSITNPGFLVKLDKNGDFLWGKYWTNSDISTYNSVRYDNLENIVRIGTFNKIVDLDPGAAIKTATALMNGYFLVKLNTNGEYNGGVTWQVDAFNFGNQISIGSDNSIYIGGTAFSPADLDPTIATEIVNRGPFIIKLDSEGSFLWSFGYNYPCSGPPGIAHSVTSDNALLCITAICDSVDIDPSAGIHYEFGGYTGGDHGPNGLIIKLKEGYFSNLSETSRSDNHLSIFPNPTNGRFQILQPDYGEWKQVLVFNIVGQQVLVLDQMEDTKEYNLELPSGVYYFYSVKNKRTSKVIVLQ